MNIVFVQILNWNLKLKWFEAIYVFQYFKEHTITNTIDCEVALDLFALKYGKIF